MTEKLRRWPVEILFVLFMVGAMLGLSLVYDLPLSFPSGGSAAFVGIHYLYPLLGVGVWACFALIGQGREIARVIGVALPCYAVILLVHFNLKLWMPHVNPVLYDDLYWQVDQTLRPVIDACMFARRAMSALLPMDSNFYMVGFIGLFYVSFCYHALRTPERFRQLFLAALFFQGLGGLAYMLWPALGPFIYEPGLNPNVTQAQQHMLQFYRDSVANGPDWLEANGPAGFTAGLGAMPSLHTGGAFLFLIFAWRYGRVLVPLYALVTAFILIAAVSTRWHYLIDLPPGLVLAWLSVKLADLVSAPDRQSTSEAREALAPAMREQAQPG